MSEFTEFFDDLQARYDALPTMTDAPKPTRVAVAKKEALLRVRKERVDAFMEALEKLGLELDDDMLFDVTDGHPVACFDAGKWWPQVTFDEWWEEES